MSLYTDHLLSIDEDFKVRCVAAAARAGVPGPFDWALERIHLIAAAPGFGAKYESALLNGVENPGRDEAVIADGEIEARVQQLRDTAARAEGA
jgi:hypothetical protein